MHVTLAKLQKLHACTDAQRRFRRLFPNGVRVTQTLCVRYADDFDWDWAVDHLVPGDWRPTRDTYDKILNDRLLELCAQANVEPSHNYEPSECGFCTVLVRYESDLKVLRARTFARLVRDPAFRTTHHVTTD